MRITTISKNGNHVTLRILDNKLTALDDAGILHDPDWVARPYVYDLNNTFDVDALWAIIVESLPKGVELDLNMEANFHVIEGRDIKTLIFPDYRK